MTMIISLCCLSLISNPGEKVMKGWLGVNTQNLTSAVKVALKTDYGVLVIDVVEGSPAQKGGLEVGDVILDVDGEKVFSEGDLEYTVRRRPNKKVEVTVLRRGGKQRITVELGAKEYEEYVLKLPPLTFPEDLERVLKNLKPRWEEEMEELRREMQELREEIKELKKKIEKGNRI